MLNCEFLLGAFGKIDDELIDGARDIKAQKEPLKYTPRVFKIISIAACFVLIFSITLFQTMQNSNFELSVNIVGDPMFVTSSEDPLISALHKQVWLTQEQAAEYFGTDYSALNLPDNLIFIAPQQHLMIVQNDDTVVQDIATFSFNKGNTAFLSIGVSKLKMPQTMFFESTDENPKASNLNDVEVFVYGSMPINGQYEILIATFMANGNYFEVTAMGITLDTFGEVLEILTK